MMMRVTWTFTGICWPRPKRYVPIFGSACVYTAETRPLTRVSLKLLYGSRPNLMLSYLPTISPDHCIFSPIFQFSYFFYDFYTRHRRPSSVRPSVTRVSQKPLHGSTPNCMESYLIHHISYFFLFLKFSPFTFLRVIFAFSLAWDPRGANVSKRYSSYNYHPT